ncbi:piggyBac transposable element-derived protein 4 [Danaus plexippus plexippus]|uniref:PiggyBac transposable element-derived protein 4 n=1 Tax=Danaus plexippus plexippus TaxID=278856 RepID=A0A212FPU3_DANPL|nr:piggyBac transposable element-derived protein 4 [Danaus plexippus plexippus]
MGLHPKPSIEHYWKLDVLYYNPLMHRINMSYNRFSSILRYWHFTEVQIGVVGEQRTPKIDPLVHKVINNFCSLYIPSDVIVADESMVKFHGKLIIRTYNPAKADHYGMKIYKACTINSYTWSYQIYSRSSHQLEGLDKPGSTVIQLTEPLLDAGGIIVAHNYYTSLPLAEYLKGRNTDLCGTLRKNKRNLPKEVAKAKLRTGEQIARQKDNLYIVLKWHDKRDVLMISTCHGDSMSNVTTKRGDVLKPDALIDYNDAKKGIDISDQLASLHSALRKGLTWYKKKAVHILFQVAIINARCIYNEVANGPMLTVLQVQEQLVRHLLGPAASTTESYHLLRSSISCSPPRSLIASSSYSGHSLQEIPRNANNKLVCKRCTGCI